MVIEASNVDLWPVFPKREASREERVAFFCVIAVVSAFCVSLGYLFSLFYERENVDIGNLILCSGISTLGYLLVLLGCVAYLRTYMPFWTFGIFSIVLGFIFLLVSFKHHVNRGFKPVDGPTISSAALNAYVSAALFEELIKLAGYLLPIILSKELRTVYDLAYLSVCSGCSFATIENLISAYYGTTTALNRFVWCTATHSSDTLIGGLILAHIVTSNSRSRWLYSPFIIAGPVALHGTYDFVIFLGKDLKADWLSAMSIAVGVCSLLISLALFWPFRRQYNAQLKNRVITVPESSSNCLV